MILKVTDLLQHNQLLPLKFISRFDIAKKVPVDGEANFADLATTSAVDQSTLSRILRLGIAYRVFREPRPGVIAHSAASRVIAEDPDVADFVGANADEMWPAADKVYPSPFNISAD